MDDLRDFFQFAWHSFGAKLVVVIGFSGALAGLAAFFLVPVLPPEVLPRIRWGLGIFLALLFILTAVLGTFGAMRQVRKATKDAQDAWAQVQSLQEEKDALSTKVATHRMAQTVNAALHGLVRYKFKVECDLDALGGMTVDHQIEFAATREGIDSIESFTWLPTTEQANAIQIEASAKQMHGIKIYPDVIEQKPEGLVKGIRTIPSLPLGKRLSYGWKETLPTGSFAMTLDEMQGRGLPYEYYFVGIRCPTELLDLSVLLPHGFEPNQPDCDVWYGQHTRVQYLGEYARLLEQGFVKTKWVKGRLKVHVEVKFPIYGLVYVVKWLPPVVWAPPSA